MEIMSELICLEFGAERSTSWAASTGGKKRDIEKTRDGRAQLLATRIEIAPAEPFSQARPKESHHEHQTE